MSYHNSRTTNSHTSNPNSNTNANSGANQVPIYTHRLPSPTPRPPIPSPTPSILQTHLLTLSSDPRIPESTRDALHALIPPFGAVTAMHARAHARREAEAERAEQQRRHRIERGMSSIALDEARNRVGMLQRGWRDAQERIGVLEERVRWFEERERGEGERGSVQGTQNTRETQAASSPPGGVSVTELFDWYTGTGSRRAETRGLGGLHDGDAGCETGQRSTDETQTQDREARIETETAAHESDWERRLQGLGRLFSRYVRQQEEESAESEKNERQEGEWMMAWTRD